MERSTGMTTPRSHNPRRTQPPPCRPPVVEVAGATAVAAPPSPRHCRHPLSLFSPFLSFVDGTETQKPNPKIFGILLEELSQDLQKLKPKLDSSHETRFLKFKK